MLVKEGDSVKAGSPLFFNKYNEKIIFTSPVSGSVKEIRRGAKRVLLEVVIEATMKMTLKILELPILIAWIRQKLRKSYFKVVCGQ